MPLADTTFYEQDLAQSHELQPHSRFCSLKRQVKRVIIDSKDEEDDA